MSSYLYCYSSSPASPIRQAFRTTCFTRTQRETYAKPRWRIRAHLSLEEFLSLFSDVEAKGDDDASLINVFLSFTQQRVVRFSRTRDSFTKIFLTGVRPVLTQSQMRHMQVSQK